MCAVRTLAEVKFGSSRFLIFFFLISDLEPIFLQNHVPVFVIIEIFLAISGLICFVQIWPLYCCFFCCQWICFVEKKKLGNPFLLFEFWVCFFMQRVFATGGQTIRKALKNNDDACEQTVPYTFIHLTRYSQSMK